MVTTSEMAKGRTAAELQEAESQPIISDNKSRYWGPRKLKEYELRNNLATMRALCKIQMPKLASEH